MKPNRFTIRVYGILRNDKGNILISKELIRGQNYCKFPGGGLEFGEGAADAVIREFFEETGLRVKILRHIYTSDYFIQSYFDPEEQVIGIYYEVVSLKPEDMHLLIEESVQTFREGNNVLRFEWMDIHCINQKVLSFEMDQRAFKVFQENLNA